MQQYPAVRMYIGSLMVKLENMSKNLGNRILTAENG